MVPERRLALIPVDYLLGGYVLFTTGVILVRGPLESAESLTALLINALLGILIFLFGRLRDEHRTGRILHTLYPLLMLLPLYSQIGFINSQLDESVVFHNDAIVQGWEQAVFGAQISYTLIREHPSVFWSGLLHFSYFAYYAIILTGPPLLVLRGRHEAARHVQLVMLTAFIVCYLFFVLFPVAGPNYAFPHPVGPVRDVWSARLVYSLLEGGSSFGAAFPSSHVAATLASTMALWMVWRRLALIMALPAALLVVATVYCQMHYGVDATVGILVALAAAFAGRSFLSIHMRRDRLSVRAYDRFDDRALRQDDRDRRGHHRVRPAGIHPHQESPGDSAPLRDR